MPTDYVHLKRARLKQRFLRNNRPTDERTFFYGERRIIAYKVVHRIPDKFSEAYFSKPFIPLVKTWERAVIAGVLIEEKYRKLHGLDVSIINYLSDEFPTKEDIENLLNIIANAYDIEVGQVTFWKKN